jgi:hypothetical protein
MGYLQLAEEDPYMHLAEVPAQNMKYYVFIPEGYRGASKDMYVREDVLDNLPKATYAQIMGELDAYQNKGLSASKEERATRRANREERKTTRANAGKTRQEARTERQRLRSENKGKGGGFKGILDTVAGTARDIFGKGNVEVDAGSGGFSVDVATQPEESFFSKYKIPLILGGAAIIGGTIFLLTRKK